MCAVSLSRFNQLLEVARDFLHVNGKALTSSLLETLNGYYLIIYDNI